MNRTIPTRAFFVLFFILLGIYTTDAKADTFFGEVKTGLVELKDFKHPVFLYVPDNLKPGRKYPLFIVLSDTADKAEEHIKEWTGFADRTTSIVLAPTSFWTDDVPDKVNKWMFEIKSFVESAYPVNPTKVYLVGTKTGTPYTAYLGVNYPEDFSAVALLEGSWVGVFHELLEFDSDPRKQVPLFVALKDDQTEILAKTEESAKSFQDHGYTVELKTYSASDDFTKRAFKKELHGWLLEKGEAWEAIRSKENLSWKEKFRKGFREFFTV